MSYQLDARALEVGRKSMKSHMNIVDVGGSRRSAVR
jgi:hypothetical protein